MPVSRRHFVAGALAAPVMVRFATLPAAAKAPMPTTQVAAYQQITVGDAVVTAISDGFLDLDVALLSNVTADEAAEILRNEFRGPSPVKTGVNAYVVNTPERTVLIDAGGAGAFPNLGGLVANLEAGGIAPDAIDAVLMTHLHPDHIGGLVTDGKPTFPNADAHVHKTELEFWTSAANRDGAPEGAKGFFDGAKAAMDAYGDRVKTFEGDGKVLPGIAARELFGHTPGHCGFLVGEGEEGLLIWGDIVHVGPIQFAKPEVGISFDAQPDKAIETRKAILKEASANRTRIAGMHIAFPGVGHVVAAGEGSYAFEPAAWQYDFG